MVNEIDNIEVEVNPRREEEPDVEQLPVDAEHQPNDEDMNRLPPNLATTPYKKGICVVATTLLITAALFGIGYGAGYSINNEIVNNNNDNASSVSSAMAVEFTALDNGGSGGGGAKTGTKAKSKSRKGGPGNDFEARLLALEEAVLNLTEENANLKECINVAADGQNTTVNCDLIVSGGNLFVNKGPEGINRVYKGLDVFDVSASGIDDDDFFPGFDDEGPPGPPGFDDDDFPFPPGFDDDDFASRFADSSYGIGNIFIGVDPTKDNIHDVTGYHNIILGSGHTVTSHGSIVSGVQHTVSGDHAVAISGQKNTAVGRGSSVLGGYSNTAKGPDSSISGGGFNTAKGPGSSVSGGQSNTAEGYDSSVLGGRGNTARGDGSSVLGGYSNTAEGRDTKTTGTTQYSTKPGATKFNGIQNPPPSSKE